MQVTTMSHLTVYEEYRPGTPIVDTGDAACLAKELAEGGIRFERWEAARLFVIHANGRVYSMLCEKDDLISVPANARHWFDLGPNPSFAAIRLFNNLEGWVANFTGDRIAGRFPLLDN